MNSDRVADNLSHQPVTNRLRAGAKFRQLLIDRHGTGSVITLLLLIGVVLLLQPSRAVGQVDTSGPSKMAGVPGFHGLSAELREFSSWEWRTGPFEVSQKLYTLCSARHPFAGHTVDPKMDNFSQLPDEKQRYAVEIFANAIAAAHLAAESIDSFPVGSVIVKEKLEIGESNNTPNNLGVMIKRPAGFFPQGGDWEFQYITPDGRVNNDRKSLANCYACHLASTGTAALDLVFAGAGYMDMAIELRRRLGHHESIWLKIETVRGSEDRLIAGTRVSLIARQDSGGSSVEEVLVRDARVALDFRYLLEQNLLTIPQDSRNNFILAIPPVSRPAIQNAAGKASLILDFKESDQSVSWIARAAHVRREREKERRYRQMRAPKVTVDGEIHVLDNGELRKESK